MGELHFTRKTVKLSCTVTDMSSRVPPYFLSELPALPLTLSFIPNGILFEVGLTVIQTLNRTEF